jgi:hypothetical protein
MPLFVKSVFSGLFVSSALLFLSCGSGRRVRLPDTLREVSGLAPHGDGTLWMLNDGGNEAVLYRVDPRTGAVLEQRTPGLTNRDWEDLASDQKGYLYIGDTGNNRNNRKDLCIYRWRPSDGKTDSIFYNYPDQRLFPPLTEQERQFDCEALIFYNDSLHLFTKSRFNSNHLTRHYVLPAVPGRYKARLRDSLRLPGRVVSGAGISADGKVLALTSYLVKVRLGFIPTAYATLWLFENPGNGRFLQGKYQKKRLPKFLIARQFESVVELSPGKWRAANESIGPQKAALWRVGRRK